MWTILFGKTPPPCQTSARSPPVHAWTNSTIILNWLDGSPKRFKTYVENRISTNIDLMPPDKWKHMSGLDNPSYLWITTLDSTS